MTNTTYNANAKVSFTCPCCFRTSTFNLYQSFGYVCECGYDFGQTYGFGSIAVDERTGEYGA